MKNPTSHSYFSERLRLHYLDWGNEAASSLLLVHGVQDHCHTWDWFAREFVDDFHVVAPDLRGHGDSEWAKGSSYHHLDYVYDMGQLIHQAALEPVNIVAHSMGGTLAALYAGTYPERVRSLVILEGVGIWPGWSDATAAHERIRFWIDSTRQLAGRSVRRYATMDEALGRMQQANPHLSSEQAKLLTVHGSNQNEDGTYSWKFDNYTHAHPAYGIPSEQVVELWERIDCPVLIINAAEGFDHRIGQAETLRHFANVQMLEIEDAGHWVHHDQLQRVTAHTRSFLGAPGSC